MHIHDIHIMELNDMITFCDHLLNQSDQHVLPKLITNKTVCISNTSQDDVETRCMDVEIQRIDTENLMNFTQIWTDVMDVNNVNNIYENSEFETLEEFQKHNNLYHIGKYYVKVNENVSSMEFYGLISKIPWDYLKLPSLNQIHHNAIVQLFAHTDNSDQVAVQLMVLGDHLQFWTFINPYSHMIHTPNNTKILLMEMGNLSIHIKENFIEQCGQLLDFVKKHQV